ncbi:MAG TPA: hypothetical protein VFS21_03075 [Roseiflexaceae bacterium]|nr:hypothetical protein [Roseiflexaceae bacterium]
MTQIEQEIEQERTLLHLAKRRLFELDQTATTHGYTTPAHIQMEREDLAAEIERRETLITTLERQRTGHQEQDEAMTAIPATNQPAQQPPLREVVSGLAQQVADLAPRVRTIEDRSEADGRTLARQEIALYAAIALGVLNLALSLAGLILALATR